MEIAVLCSDRKHHSWKALSQWAADNQASITDDLTELKGGDLLLLVSCTDFVAAKTRALYRSTFLVHESALPEGRGWSPLAWQILDGRTRFTVSLLTAEDEIDSGGIIAQTAFDLEGHELSEEINAARDKARTALMSLALLHIGEAGTEQKGNVTRYPRRLPAYSRLNPEKTIANQFDLLRICEPRFPAFFDLRGHRYEVTVRKIGAVA